MKRLLLSSLLVLFLLSSCDLFYGQPAKSKLEEVYDSVLKYYAQGKGDAELFVSWYGTLRLNTLWYQAEKYGGDDLVIDYDPWIMAQDFDNPTATVTRVVEASSKRVVLEVVLEDFGDSQTVRVAMEYDADEWRVADFLHEFEGQWYSFSDMLKEALGDS